MARLLARSIPGDGLLIHSAKRSVGRSCRCEGCWSPRFPRVVVRLARHAQKRRERRAWQCEALAT